MRLLPVDRKFVDSFLVLMLWGLITGTVKGQNDETPPVTPIFILVTLNPTTGNAEMTWSPSPSSDVAGYVVYLYKNGEGYAIDTIYDRNATSFSTPRPFTKYFSESFVVSAIDSSGNISPLSNELQTIHSEALADTCSKKIMISWNKYLSFPVKVIGYDVYASVNGGTYYLAGHVSDVDTSLELNDFINGSTYCFIVKALLENDLASGSNNPCILVRTQVTPIWINADFATVTAPGEVSLSFSIDPASETEHYILERKTGSSGSFNQISQIQTDDIKINYTDNSADPEQVNFYRIWAVNNCNISAIASNLASNILLTAQISESDIILNWNKYREWLGTVSSYRLFMDTGDGFKETATVNPADTVFRVSIPEIMYDLIQGKACFYISASESDNPYGIVGESASNNSCVVVEELITVPNVFTPDGDLKNDLFRPVLTFTPAEYRLLVSNRQGKTLFETNDFMEAWDGSDNGSPVNEGVYLWFIKIKTQDGKSISRTGTVTVVKN
jgi:gliding motility-associated-like protein